MLRTLALAVLVGVVVTAAPTRADEPSWRDEIVRLRRESRLRPATITSIEYLFETADRIEASFPAAATSWRARARRYLERARSGHDPYQEARGEITTRGYLSPVSTRLQGYGIYVPRDYDPARRYPVYVALHGGSSNGNIFLGVVLGNNLNWLEYPQHLYDDFAPQWTPAWIVVTPTGFGQVLWRWMGERDVLDVIDEVLREYSADPDRVVLGGLSNGGLGAYAIGFRHASRFAAVQAIAGAPSWLQYVGAQPTAEERPLLVARSGLHLLDNAHATRFFAFHGNVDPGPMRPAFVRELEEAIARTQAPVTVRWYEAGHDILYRVHRHGNVYEDLAAMRRDPHPTRVVVVTGDYRAATQHWLTITRIYEYPELARVEARAEGARVDVTTDNVEAFAIDLRGCPVADGAITIAIDGENAFHGARTALGHVASFTRRGGHWSAGFPDAPPGTLVKRPGLSGPITDAYFDRMVHVYGTRTPEHRDLLERAAQRGARGWPLWSWDIAQEVIADTDVTPAIADSAHLVLYGSPGDNAVLERIAPRLPIRVERDAVVVGNERFAGNDVGVRFVYPNPEAPGRYVIVQAAISPDGVEAGNGLPEFLPDFIVYDADTVQPPQPRVTGRRNPARAMGYFDGAWQLPSRRHGGGDPDDAPPSGALEEAPAAVPGLPVPDAPPVPPRPTRFAAPRSDPAGLAARRIADRVLGFPNFRAMIAGASWRIEPRAVWSIRATSTCLADLAAAGVPARPASDLPTPIPTPVEIVGPIDGVWLRSAQPEEPVVIACEMATRLPVIARIAKKHGIAGIEVMSSYRTRPMTSFHTMGLALDLPRFFANGAWRDVATAYEATPDRETCEGPEPADVNARRLRRFACELASSRRFSSVLTPNYNEGHRDHLHVDARPDDPRIFVR